jgi:hypothetical protein
MYDADKAISYFMSYTWVVAQSFIDLLDDSGKNFEPVLSITDLQIALRNWRQQFVKLRGAPVVAPLLFVTDIIYIDSGYKTYPAVRLDVTQALSLRRHSKQDSYWRPATITERAHEQYIESVAKYLFKPCYADMVRNSLTFKHLNNTF